MTVIKLIPKDKEAEYMADLRLRTALTKNLRSILKNYPFLINELNDAIRHQIVENGKWIRENN